MATWHSRNRKGCKNPNKKKPPKPHKPGKKTKAMRYPWEVWFGRSKFVLRKGRDYICSTYMMVQQIRNMAGKRFHGVSITVKVIDREKGIRVNVLNPISPRSPSSKKKPPFKETKLILLEDGTVAEQKIKRTPLQNILGIRHLPRQSSKPHHPAKNQEEEE